MYNSHLPIVGYFADLDQGQNTAAALEALQNNQTAVPNKKSVPKAGENSQAPDNDTSTIYKKDGAYYAYLNVYDVVSSWGINTNDFIIWLSTLSADDTVYLSLTGPLPSVSYLAHVLSAIDCCAAKTIFVVDHLVESALFLAVVKEIDVRRTGAVTFVSGINTDPNKYDAAWLPYLKSLFDRMVGKGLLTQEEATAIVENNAIVCKTYRQLKPTA